MIEDMKCHVKVTSKVWYDGRTLNVRNFFTVMKRKSDIDFINLLIEEGREPEEVLARMTTTLDVADGDYWLKMYETEFTGEYGFELIEIE